MTDGVDVSVIVCTRNRSARVRDCLDSIMVSVAATPWACEVLVVDNASQDDTPSVIAELADMHPCIRYVREDRTGLSRARNRGVEEARGSIVLFADDDIVVPSEWVVAMTKPILEESADAVGGRVVIADHLRRPWMTPRLRLHFAETVFPDPDLPAIVGPSMAFRREWGLRIPFDEELGAGALGDGETELFNYQLRVAGARILPSHAIAVEHRFDPERLRRSALLSHAVGDGRSCAYVAHHWHHTTLRWSRLRLAKHHAQLWWFRRTHPTPDEGITECERGLVFDISFQRQLIDERRREHRYEYRSLPLPRAVQGQQ